MVEGGKGNVDLLSEFLKSGTGFQKKKKKAWKAFHRTQYVLVLRDLFGTESLAGRKR